MAENINSIKLDIHDSNAPTNSPIIVMYPGLAEPTDEYLLFTRQIGLDTVLVAGLPAHLRNV